MRPPLFNFIPVKQYEEKKAIEEKFTVSINLKSGSMVFSNSYATNRGLEDSVIRFYWDTQNQALAWHKDKAFSPLSTTADRIKVEKKNRRGGHSFLKVNIKGILKRIGCVVDRKLKNVEIGTYAGTALIDAVDYIRIGTSSVNDEQTETL